MEMKHEGIESGPADGVQRSAPLLQIAFGLGVVGAIVIGLGRLRLRRVIEEFEVQQPAIMDAAHSIWLPVAFAVLLIATIGIEFSVKSGRMRNRWNLLAMLLGVLGLAFFVIVSLLSLGRIMMAITS